MNKFVKNKIKPKNKITKIMLKMGEQKLQIAINDVFEIIDKRKNDYKCHLASKLNNPKTGGKNIGQFLSHFIAGKKYHSFLLYCIIIP